LKGASWQQLYGGAKLLTVWGEIKGPMAQYMQARRLPPRNRSTCSRICFRKTASPPGGSRWRIRGTSPTRFHLGSAKILSSQIKYFFWGASRGVDMSFLSMAKSIDPISDSRKLGGGHVVMLSTLHVGVLIAQKI
jgi:hypothetical protein